MEKHGLHLILETLIVMLYFSVYTENALYSLHSHITVFSLVFLQTGIDPKGPSVLAHPDLPSVDNMLSTHTVSPGEHVPSVSPEAPPPANLPSVPPTSVSLYPEKLQPCCEFSSQRSEEPTGSGASPQPPALAPSPLQDRADGEEGRPSEDSCMHIPTTDMNQPGLEQEKTSSKPTSHACASAPSVTFDLEVAEGMSEPTAGWLEDSSRFARHHEGSTATVVFPVAEGQAWLGSESESPASPEVADNQTLSPDVSELSQSSHEQDVSETEDASQNPLNSSMEDSELQAEPDISRNLMSSAVFLGGIVSLSIVLQEPSSLFFIGLLLVLRRL